MTCDEVRGVLPAYVDRELHAAGEVDEHLVSCAECRAELAAYRHLIGGLAGLRDRGEEPSADLLARTLALIPAPRLADRILGSVQAHPLLVAVSAGAVAVGAAAVALSRRRYARAAERVS